jgi:hypothetical protein
MSDFVATVATGSTCVLLLLIGLGNDGLIVPALGLGLVAWMADRRRRAVQEEELLRAHGLRRIQVGQDRIYVERRDDE